MLERFLTFQVDGELYALPANQVAEVIRLPAVARVPQAPKGLLGLANLRGSVLPVASSLSYGEDFIDPVTDALGFSALFQGLLLSPGILAGRERGNDLVRRPFVEATLGGGTVATDDGSRGTRSFELQGFGQRPVPVSGYLLLEQDG